MRRVYLDLWGRLPDTDPGDPVKIIDQNVEFSQSLHGAKNSWADPDPKQTD